MPCGWTAGDGGLKWRPTTPIDPNIEGVAYPAHLRDKPWNSQPWR